MNKFPFLTKINNPNREKYDFYATEPRALEELLKHETFSKNIWECACGQGHLSEVLKKHNYNVRSSDVINRGYPCEILDFTCITNDKMWDGDILTNPPFALALNFIYKALSLVNNGSKVAMLLRIQFLESKARKDFFRNFPLKTLYLSSSRIQCAKNGIFNEKKPGSAICYGWFIWEKGYKGKTELKWFN